MTAQSAAGSDRRERLSRERVMEAATGLADRSGLSALTMRGLARELGVEAMTVYHYVASKEELLNSIVDRVEAKIELPPPETDWKEALRGIATSYHDLQAQHPWAASLALSATGERPARLRYMNAMLGTLRRAGFSADMTDHGYHALDSHISGYTLWAAQIDMDADDLPGLAMGFVEALPPGEFPYLVEHVHQHLKPRSPDEPGEFAFGLELILDGLDRLRITQGAGG